jgi:glutamine cyclotransferase
MLDYKYFGEGSTVFNNKIYMLTWREKKIFVFDLNNLSLIEELDNPS